MKTLGSAGVGLCPAYQTGIISLAEVARNFSFFCWTCFVPLEKFHSCAQQAMKREVFQDEFSDRQSLAEEFIERISKATLVELTGKIHPKQVDGISTAS